MNTWHHQITFWKCYAHLFFFSRKVFSTSSHLTVLSFWLCVTSAEVGLSVFRQCNESPSPFHFHMHWTQKAQYHDIWLTWGWFLVYWSPVLDSIFFMQHEQHAQLFTAAFKITLASLSGEGSQTMLAFSSFVFLLTNLNCYGIHDYLFFSCHCSSWSEISRHTNKTQKIKMTCIIAALLGSSLLVCVCVCVLSGKIHLQTTVVNTLWAAAQCGCHSRLPAGS